MVCGESQAGEAACLPESAVEGQHGPKQAVVVVDPLSSGAVLAQVIDWFWRGFSGLDICIYGPGQASRGSIEQHTQARPAKSTYTHRDREARAAQY